ncbi:hypothetical protein B0T24DRAFT_190743 [Lasiosphaeria ovina]|uniref:Uncharacterized protein n=1 Tax=Lasiosphaeria ovina TaxID=92902 RepID=A0AAE0NF40_9PEZI|nr:hypothetical protein B0T24DRAFT_190743 [Lasiosphaeria ovina]
MHDLEFLVVRIESLVAVQAFEPGNVSSRSTRQLPPSNPMTVMIPTAAVLLLALLPTYLFFVTGACPTMYSTGGICLKLPAVGRHQDVIHSVSGRSPSAPLLCYKPAACPVPEAALIFGSPSIRLPSHLGRPRPAYPPLAARTHKYNILVREVT